MTKGTWNSLEVSPLEKKVSYSILLCEQNAPKESDTHLHTTLKFPRSMFRICDWRLQRLKKVNLMDLHKAHDWHWYLLYSTSRSSPSSPYSWTLHYVLQFMGLPKDFKWKVWMMQVESWLMRLNLMNINPCNWHAGKFLIHAGTLPLKSSMLQDFAPTYAAENHQVTWIYMQISPVQKKLFEI